MPCPTSDYPVDMPTADPAVAQTVMVAIGFALPGQASGSVPVLCPTCRGKILEQLPAK